MRFKAVYLLTVAAGIAAALTLAGSAAAAADPACGTTLLANFTLTADINCNDGVYVGPALKIGQAGITINLNGHTITGDAAGDPVIDNATGLSQGYDGLTVTGGTIVANGTGPAVDNSAGGNGLVVSNMTLTGPSGVGDSTAIDPTNSTGISITGNTVSGFRNGVVLTDTMGALVKGNTFTTYDAYGTNACAGVRENGGTGDMIIGNTFTGTAQSCYGLWTMYSAGTEFSSNTATLLNAGVKSIGGSAGLMITGNVLGGAAVSGTLGNNYGIWLSGTFNPDSGDIVNGNYVRNNLNTGVYSYDAGNSTYTNNVLNANIGDNFYIDAGGMGAVTVVNNYSNSGSDGFDIRNAYSATVPGGPYTLVSGNTALLNDLGFYTDYNVGATFTNNIAGVINYGNTNNGFEFNAPLRNTISSNSATNNGGDGFYFYGLLGPAAPPLAVTNNSAMYNGGWGFTADDPVAGSGNTTGSTNTTGDCQLVAGCS